MNVSVVIVTFNNQRHIGPCLDSVLREKPNHLIVVDNHSTDETVALIKENYKTVVILLLSKNIGYAGGNNQGIECALQSETKFVLILNPDTILLPGMIERLVNAATKKDSQGIFGPKIFADTSKKIVWSAGGYIDKKRYTAGLIWYQQKECDFLSGTCLLIPRKLLERGLRFYEQYFLYYEDVEFCVKARGKGYPSIVVPNAHLTHTESSRKRQQSKNYYLARNHLLFVERNAPFRVQLRELLRLPKTIQEHVIKKDTASQQGIRDYFLRRFGATYEE